VASNVVDLVKSMAGMDSQERLADGAARWAEQLKPQGIIDFANAYQEYVATWRGLPQPGAGLRPYTPVAAPVLGPPSLQYAQPELRPSTLAVELGLGGIGYENVALDTERLVGKLKQLLLYCESVAIDNPLGPTHELWYGAPTGGVLMGGAQAWALARYVELLAVLEPLITSGALILVEHPYGVDPQRPDLPGWLQAERDVLEEIDERVRPSGWSSTDEDTFEEFFRHAAIIDMARSLSLAGRTHALHAYAPSQRFQDALREAHVLAFQIVSEELGFLPPGRDQDRDLDAGRLDKLLAMPFPGLERLPLRDITKVREGPELSALRRDLGRALDRVLGDPTSGDLDWGHRAGQQLAAELADSRERIRRDVDKSQVLRRASRRTTRNFVLSFGSVGTGASLVHDLLESGSLEAAVLKGLVDGAVAGALTTIGIVRDEYRRDRQLPAGAPRDPGALAAYHHLCVLSPPDPD
jgi:hypothetical protein